MSIKSVLLLSFIVLITIIVGCKKSVDGISVSGKSGPHFGAKVILLSKSGELFENNAFLPLPLNHAIMLNGAGDTLDVLIMAKPIEEDSTYVFPYGYFEVRDNDKMVRPFVFALPEDKGQMIMPREGFQEFMLNRYPIKQIIDTWFSNYKGQSNTRVQNWKETYFAEDFVKNFLKMDITNTAVDTMDVN